MTSKNGRDFSELLEAPDRCKEKGVKFRLVGERDKKQVERLIEEEYAPDEPIQRSVGLGTPKTKILRRIMTEITKDLIKTCVTSPNGYSVAAVNQEDEIIGIKLGYLITSDDKYVKTYHMPWVRHFYWAIPEYLVNINIVAWYLEDQLRFNPSMAMKDVGVQSMFGMGMLTVTKKARGLGLGKEMVRTSMGIARELGAEMYFTLVSGIYSQKIYRDLGFSVLKELVYEDVKDRRGKTILNDTREHTKAQNVFIKL